MRRLKIYHELGEFEGLRPHLRSNGKATYHKQLLVLSFITQQPLNQQINI